MRSLNLFLLIVILISFSGGIVLSQESTCSQKLKEAREKYNAGLVQEVPGLLSSCIESGFTTDERFQALKLLINAYIFDENLPQAEDAMHEFLRYFPDYKLSASDTPEFASLMEQYDNKPRGSAGFFTGINLPVITVLEPFGVQNINAVSGKYHPAGPGFSLGFDYHIYLGRSVELGFDPMFMKYHFKYAVTPFPFTEVNYDEYQNKFGLPVSLYTTFRSNKVQPYLRAGIAASFLISAKSDISRSSLARDEYNFPTISREGIPVLDQRNRLDFVALLGGGLRFKFRQSYCFIDVCYNASFMDQVKNSTRNNSENENIWKYYYIQDRFRLDNIAVNFGLAKTLYHPKPK